MHLNWLMGLGGDLTGSLPNPELSAQAVIKAQVFGQRAWGAPLVPLPETDTFQVVEEARTFSPHVQAPSLNPDDMSVVLASNTYVRKQSLSEATGYIRSSQVSVRTNSNPSHVTVMRQVIDHMWSSGSLSGFAITDNGNGTVNVASGEAMLRETASAEGLLYSCNVSGASNISLTDNTLNYIYAQWNSGSPNIGVTTSPGSIDGWTKVMLYIVSREGTTLSAVSTLYGNVDYANKGNIREQSTEPFDHVVGGSQIGATGTLNFSLTAGAFYYGTTYIPHSAFDTSGADTFVYYYRNGSGGWTRATGNHAIDVLHYDNGTGTLGVTSNNKYVVHWVYVVNNSPSYLAVQFGQAQENTLAAAQLESIPTPPPTIAGLGVLVGRIIVQQGAVVFSDISSAFSTLFTPSAVTNHNDLAGLQGGTASEYYHLTNAEYTAYTGGPENYNVVGSGRVYGRSIPQPLQLQDDIPAIQAFSRTTPLAGDVASHYHSSDWTAPNIIDLPLTVRADTSMIVVDYLTVTSTLTVEGNVGIM